MVTTKEKRGQCHGYFFNTEKTERTENVEWKMENGEWVMENGEWGMGNGEWGMDNG